MNFKNLLEPTPKQLFKWEKIRAKGKWWFVLFRGILLVGGVYFVLSAIFDYPFGYPGAPSWLRLADLAYVFISSLIVGGLWGLLIWHWSEKSYLKYRQKV